MIAKSFQNFSTLPIMRSYPTQTTHATKQNTIANAAPHFFLYSYIRACSHNVQDFYSHSNYVEGRKMSRGR